MTTAMYPDNWPTCPACGRPALDGHVTCGSARCDEGAHRRRRQDEHAEREVRSMREWSEMFGTRMTAEGEDAAE